MSNSVVCVLLAKGKGEIKLPASPHTMPKILDENIGTITAAELKKLCDAWKINRKGLTKIKDLQDAIKSHFAEEETKDEEVAMATSDSDQDPELPLADEESAAAEDSKAAPPPPPQKNAPDSGNSIVSCVNACHDILRNECSIVGEKAMHDIMRLLFLKFLEPLIDSGAVDILDPKHYSVENDEHYEPDMQRLARFSTFKKELETERNDTSKDQWKSVLRTYYMTSEIFEKEDFWNCTPIALAMMLNKIEKSIGDSQFESLSHDVKGRIYEEFLNGYSNNAGKAFGQYFTTRDYIRLIFSQIPEQYAAQLRAIDTLSVLDPCMGTAGFLTETHKLFPSATLKGCEIEAETYTYALMNMILTMETLTPNNFTRGDSLVVLDPREKFDFIPTNPPYGTKMDYDKLKQKYGIKWERELANDVDFPAWAEIFPVRTNDGVALFLQYIVFKLKAGGIAIPIIPDGQIVFGKNFGKLRKYLLTKVDIPQIMYTPSGAFKHTGVKTAVLWMRRHTAAAENNPEKSIKFVETTKALGAPKLVANITYDQLAKNNWSWDSSYYKAQETPTWAGCEWKPLGEVCEINYGTRITKKESSVLDGLYPVYGSGFETFRTNIYNRSGTTCKIGRFGVSPDNCAIIHSHNYFLNDSGFTIESSIEDLHNPYLFHYLIGIKPQLFGMCGGQAQNNMDMDAFKKFKIPIPSREIQEKIVKEIDELETCKEAIRAEIESRKLVLEKFRLYKNPPFDKYADQIEWKPLGEMFDLVKGKHSSTKTETSDSGCAKFITVAFKEKWKNTDIMDADGEIIMISNVSTGKVWRIHYYLGKYAFCDLLYQMRPKRKNEINLRYAYYYLIHHIQEKMDDFIKGSANKSLNRDTFERHKIPVPPMETQEEFVRFYEAKEAEIQKMEADIENTKAYLRNLDNIGRTIIENLAGI